MSFYVTGVYPPPLTMLWGHPLPCVVREGDTYPLYEISPPPQAPTFLPVIWNLLFCYLLSIFRKTLKQISPQKTSIGSENCKNRCYRLTEKLCLIITQKCLTWYVKLWHKFNDVNILHTLDCLVMNSLHWACYAETFFSFFGQFCSVCHSHIKLVDKYSMVGHKQGQGVSFVNIFSSLFPELPLLQPKHYLYIYMIATSQLELISQEEPCHITFLTSFPPISKKLDLGWLKE